MNTQQQTTPEGLILPLTTESKVQYRNGNPCRIIATNIVSRYPVAVAGFVSGTNNGETITKHTYNGNFYYDGNDSKLDLVPQPTLKQWRAWKPEEVPLGAMIRRPASMTNWRGIIKGVWNNCVYVGGTQEFMIDQMLVIPSLEHSTDSGKSWHPCGVLE